MRIQLHDGDIVYRNNQVYQILHYDGLLTVLENVETEEVHQALLHERTLILQRCTEQQKRDAQYRSDIIKEPIYVDPYLGVVTPMVPNECNHTHKPEHTNILPFCAFTPCVPAQVCIVGGSC